MNGKQAKALRELTTLLSEDDGWSKGYRDTNVKVKEVLDVWGNIIGTYTTSTKVLVNSKRTEYKHLKKLFRKKKEKN